MTIKALWIEDKEEDQFEKFLGNYSNIKIHFKCKSLESAKKIIRDKSDDIDVIISDANFFTEEEDAQVGEGASNLIQLANFILKEYNKQNLKIFVYSGEVHLPNFKGYKENITGHPEIHDKIFIKGDNEEKLVEEIEKFYSEKDDVKIKNEHKEIFKIEKFFESVKLIEFIKIMNEGGETSPNDLRIFLEGFLKNLVMYDYAPKKLTAKGVTIFFHPQKNDKGIYEKYLSKKEVNPFNFACTTDKVYLIKKEFRPPKYVSDLLSYTWDTLNYCSHSEKIENADVHFDERDHHPYYKNKHENLVTIYTRKSNLLNILEILNWFSLWIQSIDKPEEKNLWYEEDNEKINKKWKIKKDNV